MRVEEALKKYWGFEGLRPLQGDVVQAALDGCDALAVMPTGGGKSLCFQLPPVVDGGFTLVVSPLIALMKDQVDALRLIGYPAAALHSNLSSSEASEIRSRVGAGDVRLLYTSPERVLTPSMLDLLRSADMGRGVGRIAIDEAHCISQWGHDFRPEYRQLADLREHFPAATVHAFTATATPKVRDDIVAQLRLRDAKVFVGRFDRPNLTYRVVPRTNAVEQILAAVTAYPDDASIVYCISRKDTERMAEHLRAKGVNCAFYHAGMEPGDRKRVSEDFAQERVSVVVATVAFGMGIDRANVRCVVHESLPKSMEAYQQETGRAGRDGLPSECVMLYAPSDIWKWTDLIRGPSSPDQATIQLQLLDEVRRYAVGRGCRHAFLSEHFGQVYEPPDGGKGCGACDLCLDGWNEVEGSTRKAHQILATVGDLIRRHGDFGFGAKHIADVLTGSWRQEILRHEHETLRGHGKMQGVPPPKVVDWVGQLVDLGFLNRIGDSYPKIVLTERGAEALRGREEIALRDIPISASRKRRPLVPEDVDTELYGELRQMRTEVATERGVPAYVVFHDATLMAVASIRPTTVESLRRVPGLGDRKVEDFGEALVAIVRRHVEARGLKADQFPAVEPARQAPPSPRTDSARRLEPYFERGTPLEEIAAEVGLARSTVMGYLSTWVQETRPGDVSAWVDGETYRRVEEALAEVGYGPLKPVFDHLGGSVPYDTIRVVIAHTLARDPVEA